MGEQTDLIEFRVPGIPTGKGRARISTRGGRVRSFTPPKTVSYEARVALAAEKAMDGRDPLSGAVSAHLSIALPIAQSWSPKKKKAALSGDFKPTSRPDIDNYIKAVFDGGNGIVWNDDSQIVKLSATKFYAEIPGVLVQVEAFA